MRWNRYNFQLFVPDKDKIAELTSTKCYVEGEEYVAGQKIFLKTSQSTCICAKGFNNATFENNEHCRPLNCYIQIKHLYLVQRGCAPIYYQKVNSCPLDWICRKYSMLCSKN